MKNNIILLFSCLLFFVACTNNTDESREKQEMDDPVHPRKLVGRTFTTGDTYSYSRVFELCTEAIAYSYQYYVDGFDNVCGLISKGKWALNEHRVIVFTPESGCENVSDKKEKCAVTVCNLPLDYRTQDIAEYDIRSDWEAVINGNYGPLPVEQNIYYRSYSNQQYLCK